MKLRTIIVEDEILGQDVLRGILEMYCEETVAIVDVVPSVNQAIRSIQTNKPDLVFLDIKLGNDEEGAFDILESLDEIKFSLVFTTSSNQSESILKALNRFGVKKYLLKPLEIDEVVESVNLALKDQEKSTLENQMGQIKNLIDGISKDHARQTLQIPIGKGFQCLKFEDIIMVRAISNNTIIFLASGENLKNSKKLKEFEYELPTDQFMRVSKSYIINLNHVEGFGTQDGGTIFLTNNCTANISANYREAFFEAINYTGRKK
jgi:two-component system LytT family response regulator